MCRCKTLLIMIKRLFRILLSSVNYKVDSTHISTLTPFKLSERKKEYSVYYYQNLLEQNIYLFTFTKEIRSLQSNVQAYSVSEKKKKFENMFIYLYPKPLGNQRLRCRGCSEDFTVKKWSHIMPFKSLPSSDDPDDAALMFCCEASEQILWTKTPSIST